MCVYRVESGLHVVQKYVIIIRDVMMHFPKDMASWYDIFTQKNCDLKYVSEMNEWSYTYIAPF